MLSGCATAPAPGATARKCTSVDVDAATSAGQLRALVERCQEEEIYPLAVIRLNTLAPPAAPQLKLQAPVSIDQSVRSRLEADVFFNVFESYPHPLAFEKLEELIAKLGGSYRIEEIQITGAADPNEALVTTGSLPSLRANFVRRYLASAGVSATTRIVVGERAPKHANTPQGRASDRVVEIRITSLKRRDLQT